MSDQEPTKVAFYNNQRVRVYRSGAHVFIDQEDLDAITGYREAFPDSGPFLNPELDKIIEDAKRTNPEFADWLIQEFGET